MRWCNDRRPVHGSQWTCNCVQIPIQWQHKHSNNNKKLQNTYGSREEALNTCKRTHAWLAGKHNDGSNTSSIILGKLHNECLGV